MKQFEGCSSLTDLSVPAAEEVGRDSFYNCDSLLSVDSKLKAAQFICYVNGCTQKKNCVICREQLESCLRKGKDPQNRLRVQKELEEQKMLLVLEISSEHVWALKMVMDAQIQKKNEQLKKKDEQIEQILTQLENDKHEIELLNIRITEQNLVHQQKQEEHQQQIEEIARLLDIQVERMVEKFENLEKQNVGREKAVENFILLLADK